MRVHSTNGVTIELHDLGGHGEPLMICHATGFCGRAYEPLAAGLRADFHVWAIDFRGHGDSTVPADGDFSWSRMADDLLAAVDACGFEGIRGFGHSLGGGVLFLAELARPGLLQAAYLYEPIILPPGLGPRLAGDENPMSATSRRRRPSFPSKPEALYRYASRPPLNVLRSDALRAYVEHGFADQPDGTVTLKCAPESEALTFESDTKPTADLLLKVEVPTTVAIGQPEEGPNPAMFGPVLAETLPRGTLLQYAHLGHFGPLQDPDTVAADVVAAVRHL
jgi:pimeloyl-ACP methyl ester carboxylesterase